MSLQPYYADQTVRLYLGDCRTVLPELGERFDACVADPPYGETSLAWDRWPTGWLDAVAGVTDSLWCWGGLRLFQDRATEFRAAGWKLSHDTVGEWEIDTAVWEKGAGSGPANGDRFVRVHELAGHYYQGPWADIRHAVPSTAWYGPDKGNAVLQRVGPTQRGAYRSGGWTDNGTRLARSVIRTPSMRGRAVHETQKPTEVLAPLIEYAVPAGGTVLDPTAGSGSTAVAARLLGRRAVLIEGREQCCEIAARRLDQGVLGLAGETA
jgi:site-specific DNA-methyltransferase (adenine-specific)